MMPYEIVLDSDTSSVDDVDFFYCSFKLNNGEELFSSARMSGDMIILRHPLRVGLKTDGTNAFLSFGKYNPFTDDEFTSIPSSSVHHSNILSKKYLIEYQKAIGRVYLETSSEDDSVDDQFDEDSLRMIVAPSVSKLH